MIRNQNHLLCRCKDYSSPYKEHIKTITTDNRPEFAAHKLIRQYIPKQANFDDYTDKKIAMIQKKINNRSRLKLNFETPKKRVPQKNLVILHLLVDYTQDSYN
jgi:transposase